MPTRAELTAVPFYAQQDYQCGPAALATALNAGGVAVTPQQLTPQVYLPQRQGSLQVEMLASARRHGMIAYPLAPRLRDLLTEVAAGHPVVVMQNLAFSWHPLWHYAVVVGYDLAHAEIILRSGRSRRLIMSLTTFEHTWRRAEYWAMLAVPPNQVPARAEEVPYLNALVALETSGQARSAVRAYRSA